MSSPSPSPSNTCLYCQGQLQPFARFSSDRIVDVALTPQLKAALPELHYGRCDRCDSLIATDIRLDANFDLLLLYQQLSPDYWSGLGTGHGDRFFAFLEQQLNPQKLPLHLCDVGCGDGSFLRGLGNYWHKTGIEPGEPAAAMAVFAELAIAPRVASATESEDAPGEVPAPPPTWIQGTLATANLPPQSFDVITYIDVTEHLSDPLAELRQARQCLKPGGKLLLYTGNAQSPFAHLAGANWAYLRCAATWPSPPSRR
ncbi:MAG: class I SAM-dependent methyltransferase [Synechococcales cyanobacterium RM1_1_8]|nr:class I SAM-dependent methyltransferase [Synechococcales cyanobacterium RM1_1_8]